MNRYARTQGFSFLEIVAGTVILGVVATATVATIAPMRARAGQQLSDQRAKALNSMSQVYFLEVGRFPPRGVDSLIAAGYLACDDDKNQSQAYEMQCNFSYNRATGTFTRR